MNTVAVTVARLPHGADMPLPDYATPGSAGLDLMAAVREPVTLKPGGRTLVPTGIAIALPQGFEAQIRPRSGLALNHGVTVLNSPGTVDADYRGEVGIVLVNLGEEDFTVTRGMRVAQMVIAVVDRLRWAEVEDAATLSRSARGAGGFGSTGQEG